MKPIHFFSAIIMLSLSSCWPEVLPVNPFLVSEIDKLEGKQANPAVSISKNGEFIVIAWEDYRDFFVKSRIYVKGFNSLGDILFSEKIVSESEQDQRNPRISISNDGDFVVGWSELKLRTTYIKLAGFNLVGEKRYGDIEVNKNDNYVPPRSLDVAINAEGTKTVICWEDDKDINNVTEILASIISKDGTIEKSEFTINADFRGQQKDPAVAISNSHFVVAWEDDLDGNRAYQILANRFDFQGERVNAIDIEVNNGGRFESDGDQINPDVDMNEAGNYVISWISNKDTSFFIPYMKNYDHSDVAINGDSSLLLKINNATTDTEKHSRCAISESGDIITAWINDTIPLAQVSLNGYTSNRGILFEKKPIITRISGNINNPSTTSLDISMSSNGHAVIVWQEEFGGERQSDLLFRIIDTRGNYHDFFE